MTRVERTGQPALSLDGSDVSISIVEDLGWYEGTIEEQNVRKVKQAAGLGRGFRVFDGIEATLGRKLEKYGRSYGGTLYAITADEAAMLQQAQQAEKQATEAKSEEKSLVAKAGADTKVHAALATAKATGRPVEIEGHMEDCDGSAIDCSSDWVSIQAMPDGTTRKTRRHTH